MKRQPIYIYALKCPDTMQVRYIGKSKNPEKRLKFHLQPSQRKPHTHKNHWLNSLLEIGKTPLLEIVEETTESKWQAREKFHIKQHKKTGMLTNSTDGGDGVLGMKQAPEVVERRAAKIRGKKRSPETRALLSRILKERFAKHGNPSAERAVNQFSLDGSFISSFPSISKLCKTLDLSFDCVSAALRGRRAMYNGFLFRYADVDNSEKIPKSIKPYTRQMKKSSKVDRLTIDGEAIDSFATIPEMCNALGLHKSAVHMVLKGKRQTTSGFRFRYAS